MPARYTLDTNLYIDASRDPSAREALDAFADAVVSRLFVTGIVVQELRMGVRPGEERRLAREVFGPFERRGRVLAPGYEEWSEAGDVLRRLALAYGLPVAEISKSLVNDVHLALTCRAHGVRLVTRNVRDFTRIAGLVSGFAFDVPWPST